MSTFLSVSTAKVAIHEADSAFVSGREHIPAPKGWRGFIFRILGIFMKSGPFQPDILLKDHDTIDGLACIHIPGHTPGSICLLDPVSGALFAGNTSGLMVKKLRDRWPGSRRIWIWHINRSKRLPLLLLISCFPGMVCRFGQMHR